MTAIEVNEAGKVHAAGMAATLSEAFIDDPPLAWIMPNRRERPERLRQFFPPMVRGAIAHGLALRTQHDEAVTLWRLPGRIHPGFFENLRSLRALKNALGEGAVRAGAMSKILKVHAPRFPYWYLQFAGVLPADQGKGLGSAVILAGLDRARAAGYPVYLEAARPGNVAIYEKLGFRVTSEWDIPDGGPHFWGMLYE